MQIFSVTFLANSATRISTLYILPTPHHITHRIWQVFFTSLFFTFLLITQKFLVITQNISINLITQNTITSILVAQNPTNNISNSYTKHNKNILPVTQETTTIFLLYIFEHMFSYKSCISTFYYILLTSNFQLYYIHNKT